MKSVFVSLALVLAVAGLSAAAVTGGTTTSTTTTTTTTTTPKPGTTTTVVAPKPVTGVCQKPAVQPVAVITVKAPEKCADRDAPKPAPIKSAAPTCAKK